MIKVFRMTDRIPIKIGPVEFKIGPLKHQQKQEIVSQGRMIGGQFIGKDVAMAALAMKYQIKEVKGLVDAEGKPYAVQLDESGDLSDDCVSELMSLESSQLLIEALSGMLNGIRDPKVKGVEVKLPKLKNAKSQA